MNSGFKTVFAATLCAGLGVAHADVSVGMSLGLTGPISSVAQPFQAGVKTCFDELNRAGGVNGHKLNLQVIDDGYSPERTVVAVRKLVTQDRTDVVATLGTSTTAGAVEFMASANSVFFPWGGIRPVTEPLKSNVFGVQPTYQDQADFLIKYTVANLKPKKITMFYAEFEGMDQAAANVKKAITDSGGTVGFSASYQLGSMKAFDQVVQSLASGSPDAIFLFTTAADGAQMIKGLRARGVNVPIVGNVTFADPILTTLAGTASKDVYGVAAQEVPGAPGVADIEARIAAAYPGVKTTMYHIAGYGWCQVFAGAVSRAGTSKTLSKDDLIRGFESLNNFRVPTMPPVTYSKTNHSGIRALAITHSDGTSVKRLSDYIEYR